MCSTPGQNCCAIYSNKIVELWDLTRLCPTIKMETTNFNDERVVRTCALHPDGHSICVGYSDRIRFYRILVNKFKYCGDFSIKGASSV